MLTAFPTSSTPKLPHAPALDSVINNNRHHDNQSWQRPILANWALAEGGSDDGDGYGNAASKVTQAYTGGAAAALDGVYLPSAVELYKVLEKRADGACDVAVFVPMMLAHQRELLCKLADIWKSKAAQPGVEQVFGSGAAAR